MSELARGATETVHRDGAGSRGPAVRDTAVLVAAVAAPLLCLAGKALASAPADMVATGDFAALDLATRAATHGQQLLGPWSRFGWRHPGPALFYWNAPFYGATGGRYVALPVAAGILNALSLGAIVVACRVGAGRRGATVAAAGSFGFFAVFGLTALIEAWNPVVTVLPAALLSASCAAVVAGHPRWLPVAVVAASFVSQTHVNAAPTALALTGVAAVTVVVRRSRYRSVRGPLAVSGALVLLMWVPVLAEQVTTSPGNVSLLWRDLAGGGAETPFSPLQPDDAAQGWSTAAKTVASLASLAHVGLGADVGPTAGPVSIGFGVVQLVAFAVLAVGSIVLAGGRWPGAPPLCRAIGALTCLGLVAALTSVQRVPGNLSPYLAAFVVGLGLTGWLGIGIAVAASLDRRALERARAPVTATLAGLGLATCVLALTVDTSGPLHAAKDPPSLTPAVRDAVDGATRCPVLIVIDDPLAYGTALGVVADLERHDIGAQVTPEWEFVASPEQENRCSPAQQLTFTTDPASLSGATRLGRTGTGALVTTVWVEPG